MTAPSSPGRTWSPLHSERGLRALVPAVPAAVCRRRRGCIGVSGLARVPAATGWPDDVNALDPVDQPRHDGCGFRGVGSSLGALPLTWSVRCNR